MNDCVTIKMNFLSGLVGLGAPLAYRKLLMRWKQVEGVNIFEYEAPPHMQDRIAIGEGERRLVERANCMRHGTGVPFWEAVFATCSVEGKCSDSIVSAALFHNGQGVQRYVSRRQMDEGALEQVIKSSNCVVALGSRIFGKDGHRGHLNFLDFHCSVSEQSRALVHKVCRRLMPDGFLVLNSGGSYHACSTNIVSDEERLRTLATALLVSPIVDARYAAHQLLQDSSSLRNSSGGSRGIIPVVVDAWCPETREV